MYGISILSFWWYHAEKHINFEEFRPKPEELCHNR